MNHWIIAPVVLPAILAPLMALAMRHDLLLQRVVSLSGSFALLAIGIGLGIHTGFNGIVIYELGDWNAPFGIVLVLDPLAALMLTLTGALAVFTNLYAMGSGWDGEGWHFHPLFMFQLMGVNGAFLTGDAFNLFVFFEVMLIASYGLMIHGGGGRRLQAGLQYVVVNLAGSTLFLFALGTVYATTGTLNMADIARRIGELPPGDHALALVGATLMVVVFAVKGALLPFHFWLPGTYANAPAPVAALFAIMTKVGAYAILRLFTLSFGPHQEIVGSFFADLLLPAALLTLIVGAFGTLGSWRIERIIAFSVLASMGTLFIAISQFNPAATTAALFYLVHSTFAGAALFLVADLIRRQQAAGMEAPGGLVAALYFAAAVGMAGMPPLSGFFGKLMVLDATRNAPGMGWIWSIILVTSLITIVGLAKAGSQVFWKPAPTPAEIEEDALPPATPAPPWAVTATAGALAMMILLTVAGGPATRYLSMSAEQLYRPADYLSAVLDQPLRAIKDPHAKAHDDGAEGHSDDGHGEDSQGQDSHDDSKTEGH